MCVFLFAIYTIRTIRNNNLCVLRWRRADVMAHKISTSNSWVVEGVVDGMDCSGREQMATTTTIYLFMTDTRKDMFFIMPAAFPIMSFYVIGFFF